MNDTKAMMAFFKFQQFLESDLIDEVCHDEAFQRLKPYGTSPQIINSQNPYVQPAPFCHLPINLLQ